jgi:hypothetical protein
MLFFFFQSAKSIAVFCSFFCSTLQKKLQFFLQGTAKKKSQFFPPLQYRMHPAISQFPSDLFYGGRIMDGIDATKRPPPPGQVSRKNKPWALVLLNCSDSPFLFVVATSERAHSPSSLA